MASQGVSLTEHRDPLPGSHSRSGTEPWSNGRPRPGSGHRAANGPVDPTDGESIRSRHCAPAEPCSEADQKPTLLGA
jgi:hypothetical protein